MVLIVGAAGSAAVSPTALGAPSTDGLPVVATASGLPASPAVAVDARPAPSEPIPSSQRAQSSRRAAESAGASDPDTAAPSGLPWRSGLVVGLPEAADAWGAWRGRPVDVVHAYTDRSSWEKIETGGWVLDSYRDYPADLVISQPFWPEESGGTLQSCANGDYDTHWVTYGRALTEAGRTDAYTRLAWEFNGDWFEWSATDVDAWKACFRRVVEAVRSSAPQARFEWNMNAHGSQTAGGDAWTAYPGHDVVDVIGIDPFDHWPTSPTAADFDAQCRGNEGLCTVMEFARLHGKKVGVSEWGVIASAGGGRDNPLYIEKMFETFTANQDVMGYETYFNDPAFGGALSRPRQNPDSADRYLALFGAG